MPLRAAARFPQAMHFPPVSAGQRCSILVFRIPRTGKRHGRCTMKKDIILATAARLFAERGFARTPTSLLAEEAGVAEGTIFRHFKSKDDIFLELLLRVRNRITDDVYKYLEVCAPETGLGQIIAVIKACYIFVRKNRSDFALIFRDAPGRYGEPGGEAFEHCKVIYQLLQDHFQRGMEQGQAEGGIRKDLHPGDTACMLAASLVGLMRVVNLGFLSPSEDMLRHFVDCTTAMLQTEKKTS